MTGVSPIRTRQIARAAGCQRESVALPRMCTLLRWTSCLLAGGYESTLSQLDPGQSAALLEGPDSKSRGELGRSGRARPGLRGLRSAAAALLLRPFCRQVRNLGGVHIKHDLPAARVAVGNRHLRRVLLIDFLARNVGYQNRLLRHLPLLWSVNQPREL